uniref:D-glycero-beta-D-manno-heptose 1-phosphate adenylyltransferase n=1 Tax=candidate division WOR-3 bacterium TaxID=2052148 RepID=A0A7C4U6I4_UNCW3
MSIKFIEEERRKNKKIVFTNGCFDIIHIGHIELLRFCKENGDFLVVGINTDESIKKIKGTKRPIFPLEERKKILESIRYVDIVIPFDEETPINLIKEVRPDVLVKGGDWKENEIVGADFVKSYGGRVLIFPYIHGRSTTKIIEKMEML